METHFIAICLLWCAATNSAEQLPYPLQFFYIAPNDVRILPPLQAPVPYVAPVATLHTKQVDEDMVLEGEASQFHSQDSRGRALFGYTSPHQARIEARSEDGKVRGSYSYLDAWGKAVKVQYWDDGNGFHAAGNNLPGEIPQPVQDTPEVTAAKLQHFQLFQQALAAAIAAGGDTEGQAADTTKPQQDTSPQHDQSPHQDQQQHQQEAVVVESESTDNHEDDVPELTRYPNLQNFPQNLYDPTHIHDANREAVIVDSAENSLRNAKTLQVSPKVNQPQAPGFFYSFRYPVPVYVQVKTVQDGKPAEENNKVGISVSQKAALFGAIPVAAVHDAQVPPHLKEAIRNYQILPLYIETPAAAK